MRVSLLDRNKLKGSSPGKEKDHPFLASCSMEIATKLGKNSQKFAALSNTEEDWLRPLSKIGLSGKNCKAAPEN